MSRDFGARGRKSEMTGTTDAVADTITLSRKSRGISMVTTMQGVYRPVSCWEQLLRRFTDSHKEQCQTMDEMMDEPICNIEFPTGSSYIGPWNVRGMTGQGVYTFPGGDVVYEGYFEDGQFHGQGDLVYKEYGARLKATWYRGVVIERKLIFEDGLEYNEENKFNYCKFPDRRFTREVDSGLLPAGEAYLTAPQPTRPVPAGYYDCGYGFFEPECGMVFKYDNLHQAIRRPDYREMKWIKENCRRGHDGPVGPCPSFYEVWVWPDLDLEDPPPPAVKTANCQEEPDEDMWRDYEDDEARWRKTRYASRQSQSRSRSRAMSLAQAIGSRASIASWRPEPRTSWRPATESSPRDSSASSTRASDTPRDEPLASERLTTFASPRNESYASTRGASAEFALPDKSKLQP